MRPVTAVGAALMAATLAVACDSAFVTPIVFGDVGTGALDAGPIDGSPTDATADAVVGDAQRNDAAQQQSVCSQPVDCPADKACVVGLEESGCVARKCGLPADEGGTAGKFERCTPATRCGSGLACVWLDWNLAPGSSTYAPFRGSCLPVCDPCRSSCADLGNCVQLPEGGGFCHPGPLAAEGGVCGQMRVCQSPLFCPRFFDSGVCVRPCLPDGPFRNASNAEVFLPYSTGDSSADCPAGSVCLNKSGSTTYLEPRVFGCHPGRLVSEGQPCSNDPEAEAFCRWPSKCEGTSCTSE